MTVIGTAWRGVRDRLQAAGIANAELDAKLLAQMAFGLDDLGLITKECEIVTLAQSRGLDLLVVRRLNGEPVARIGGAKEFYGLEFGLNADTLVPRPETELVVEKALELLAPDASAHILDLGTGSGCIAVSLLAERRRARAIGVDLSALALEQAVRNASLNSVAGRFTVLAGSWFAPLPAELWFDVIVTNPPYIESKAIIQLGTEVRDFDPRRALDGGDDGLWAYRDIIKSAPARLRPGGFIVTEIGFDQGQTVSEMFSLEGFNNIAVHKDLAGLDRVIVAKH